MAIPKDIQRINEWLAREYGSDLLNRPNYRLIWTETEFEKRQGTFQEFSGPIFLREYFGMKEQRKYEYHPEWRERWMLEKMSFEPNPELVLGDWQGHYEPLYCFYGPNYSYLKPNMKAIQFFMKQLMERKPWKTDKEKWDDLNEQEKREREEEEEMFYGCLDDAMGGDLASAIRHGDGVVVPGVIHLADGSTHLFNRGSNGSDSSVDSAVRSEVGVQAGPVSGGVHDSTGTVSPSS